MNFKYTTSIKLIRKLQKRIKIIQGGSSAGKTIAILAILIDKALRTDNIRISVVSENMPHLKRGAMRDFINILKATNRYNDNSWNKSESIYRFINGSYIEFFGADEDSKLRGARRDILYINECNNIKFDSYLALQIRTELDIYLDYNPVKAFWVHTELLNEDNVDFLILNYTHNEALPDSVKEDLLRNIKKAETSDYWKNWVNVYVKGTLGSLEGVIYSNWQLISRLPDEAKLLGIGLDFGYTNDPSAVVAVYKYDDKIVLRELIYQTGLSNSDIYNILKQHINAKQLSEIPVICDSSEPKSIAELRRLGLKAKGVVKGKDSIKYGISLVQEYDMLITATSKNLITELEQYSWLKQDGKYTNIPEDKNNHFMDAMRYFFMEELTKAKKEYVIPFIL